MNHQNREQGLIWNADAYRRADIELDLGSSLEELYYAIDLVRDDARALERALNDSLYGVRSQSSLRKAYDGCLRG